MARDRQGDAGARQALVEANTLLDNRFPVLDQDGLWHDWLAAYLLCGEAERLIDGRKAESKPK
jgi:hypothetical protein